MRVIYSYTFKKTYVVVFTFYSTFINFQSMNSVEDLHMLGNLFEDFVYKKDLKRKRSDETESGFQHSSKKSKKIHSLDYEAYKERVQTFADPSWCLHFHPLSCNLLPQNLARYGWVARACVDKEERRFVKCISCQELLYLGLPDKTSATYAEMVRRQETRVTKGHQEFCPWCSSPCPASWSLVSTDTEAMISAACVMIAFNTELPWIRMEIIDNFREGVDVIVTALDKKMSNLYEKRVMETVAVLAMLGWQKGSLEDTLCDCYQVRRIGLWNFVSIQKEMDRVEDIRVAKELSGDTEIEGENSPKKREDEGRKYFDPIKEHLVWNPIVVMNENNDPGWKTVRDSFRVVNGTQTDRNAKSAESCNRERDPPSPDEAITPQSVLSKVRAMLELW